MRLDLPLKPSDGIHILFLCHEMSLGEAPRRLSVATVLLAGSTLCTALRRQTGRRVPTTAFSGIVGCQVLKANVANTARINRPAYSQVLIFIINNVKDFPISCILNMQGMFSLK